MRGLTIALVMAWAVAACSQPGIVEEPGVPTAADCDVAIRFQGMTYREAGFSSQAAEKVGRGDRSSCADVGRNPRGTYFAERPDHVTVWTFPGFDPEQVIGVRESRRGFRVLLATDLPASATRELRSALLDSRAR